MLTWNCTTIRNTECGETANTNVFTILIRVLVVSLSRIDHSKPQFFAASSCAEDRQYQTRTAREDSFPEILARCRSRAIVGDGICIECNNLSKPGNATRRSVRCILINNGEATRELLPYRMPFSCRGWTINYGAGMETQWKASLWKKNRAPTVSNFLFDAFSKRNPYAARDVFFLINILKMLYIFFYIRNY